MNQCHLNLLESTPPENVAASPPDPTHALSLTHTNTHTSGIMNIQYVTVTVCTPPFIAKMIRFAFAVQLYVTMKVWEVVTSIIFLKTPKTKGFFCYQVFYLFFSPLLVDLKGKKHALKKKDEINQVLRLKIENVGKT